MPVTFDENEALPQKSFAKRGFSSTRFLITAGFAKTEKGAQIILLSIAAVLIGICTYFMTSNNVTIEPPSADEYLVE